MVSKNKTWLKTIVIAEWNKIKWIERGKSTLDKLFKNQLPHSFVNKTTHLQFSLSPHSLLLTKKFEICFNLWRWVFSKVNFSTHKVWKLKLTIYFQNVFVNFLVCFFLLFCLQYTKKYCFWIKFKMKWLKRKNTTVLRRTFEKKLRISSLKM
jgi:hypothetical protein